MGGVHGSRWRFCNHYMAGKNPKYGVLISLHQQRLSWHMRLQQRGWPGEQVQALYCWALLLHMAENLAVQAAQEAKSLF